MYVCKSRTTQARSLPSPHILTRIHPLCPSFPKLAQRFGTDVGGETPFRRRAGEDGGALEVVVRRRGDGVSLGRALPKRCANFGNERETRSLDRRGECAAESERDDLELNQEEGHASLGMSPAPFPRWSG